MLSRFYRLPSSEIPDVLRSGKRVAGSGFMLIYKIRTGGSIQKNDNPSRFAFIVSTKTDKRATARNRLKRLLSESIRHMLPEIHPGHDCIFMANKGLTGVKQADLEANVAGLMKSAGIYEAGKNEF